MFAHVNVKTVVACKYMNATHATRLPNFLRSRSHPLGCATLARSASLARIACRIACPHRLPASLVLRTRLRPFCAPGSALGRASLASWLRPFCACLSPAPFLTRSFYYIRDSRVYVVKRLMTSRISEISHICILLM